jgi:uncharacterized protein DUF6599
MTVKIIRHFLIVSLAWFFLAAISASAQGILPSSFAGWTGTTRAGLDQPAFYNGDHAGAITRAAEASARQEYGFVSGEEGTYARGKDSLHVTLYRMKDPSGAYGYYSYLRSPEMAHQEPGDHSVMSRERALLLDGNLVLDVTGSDLPKYGADLNALVAAVTPKAEQGPLPSLTEHLPSKGFVDRSDKYVLGPVTLNEVFPVSEDDWLGFSHGAEAEVARYNVSGHEVRLLIADFPTPQVAQKRLADLQQVYHFNPKNPDANSTPLFAKRSITLLAIVSGAKTQAEADELLSQISSGSEVVWNEPTFQFKEPSIGAMIVGSIIGAGVLCMFAVVAGVAFGGFRLVVKRYFPDKVFDRSATMQVLQLGLGSKPINSDDFYGSGPSK